MSTKEVSKLRRFMKVRTQLLASLTGNIVVLGHGCCVGWLSPSLLTLLSETSPLSSGPINIAEASWIGSTISIGSIVGTFLFGILLNYVGSKTALWWCAVPLTAHWILIQCSNYVWQICIARFLAGMTGGGVFICVPLFIAEIASDHVRGSLSSLLLVNFNIGILVGLVLGPLVDYKTYPLMVMILPIIFIVLFLFFDSSPQHLLRCDKVEKAKKSLKFYRNLNFESNEDQDDFNIEFEKLKTIAELNKEADKLKIMDFCEPNVRKGMLIGFALIFVSSFSGSFALINYGATIFRESGSDIDPNTSAIALGVLQICGTICTIATIEHVGRKVLMIISTTGVTLSLSVMGTYSYLSKHEYDLTGYNLVPVISLSLVTFLSAIGIIPVPLVLVTESLPQKVRRTGATICIGSFNVFSFILLKAFPLLLDIIELYGCIAIFTATSLFGLIFTIFVVEETKGKNLDIVE